MMWGLIIIFLAFLSLFYVWWSLHRRRLSTRQRRELDRLWAEMERIPDTARRVTEADSIFTEALQRLGYRGSTGEKLKACGPRIADIDAVWRAHRLRNRISHEAGLRISESEAAAAVAAFRKAIDRL